MKGNFSDFVNILLLNLNFLHFWKNLSLNSVCFRNLSRLSEKKFLEFPEAIFH